MKLILLLLSVLALLVAISAWFVLFKGKELPPINQIENIHIYYSEAIGDLLPDDYEPKEFKITDRKELEVILGLIGDAPISRVPLINSDVMDDGQNWMINVYFKDGGFRYIPVDKKQILGVASKESALYAYLKNNYT